MHLKRWITAVIALPLVILLILKGGQVLFSITIIVIVVLTLTEYFRIVLHQSHHQAAWQFLAWTWMNGVAIIVAAHYGSSELIRHIFPVHLIGCGLLAVQRFRSSPDAPTVAVKAVFGLLYIALPLSFLVVLRNDANGVIWVSLVLWVIAWGDIGAYYVGSYLGRHKLCPSVSPKKTVEGAIGGLGANLLAAWTFNVLFASGIMPSSGWVAYALLVGVAGQVGDLFESLFKRTAGIKDSGGILPGHGGFLDRLDALLFGAPVALLLKEYLLP